MQKATVNPVAGAAAVNTALLGARLATLGQTIAAPSTAPATVTASTLPLLKQPALVALAGKDQTLASQISSISTQAGAALKDAQSKQTAYQSALAAMLQTATSLLNSSS